MRGTIANATNALDPGSDPDGNNMFVPHAIPEAQRG